MSILVIGATGKIGGFAVDGLLGQGASVRAYVRDPARARTRFSGAGGLPAGLEIVPGELDDDRALASAARGTDAIFMALGSVGEQGRLQEHVIGEVARAPEPHLVRLSSTRSATTPACAPT